MRVISLFSGAGGMDLGFIQAGHQVVWANDIDQDSVNTYKHNIGDHIIKDDIVKVDPSTIPDGDILIGGFPCQGFSIANKFRSSYDERNTLYLQFLRILRAKQPLFFVAENVRGILSLEKGQAIARIKKDFEDSGYHVDYRVLNAADFGVPQMRQRVFIIGTRKNLPESCRYVYPSPTHSKNGDLLNSKWVSISESLQGIPEPDNDTNLLNHVYSKYKVTNRNFTGHRKTDPDRPSPTILARGNGKGGVCAIQHPNNHRRLSVRESAIIQSFPLDFQFFGKLGSMYRQIGNAVPVLLARRIAEQFNGRLDQVNISPSNKVSTK